jgi:hypothetical protein
MSEEALFMSHMEAVSRPDYQLVLFDLILLGEGLLADDTLFVLLLLSVGLHDFHLSLPWQHLHHTTHVHVAATSTHFYLFFLVLHIHVRLSHTHSAAHTQGLGPRLLVNHWGRIHRWHSHGLLLGWPYWYGLWLLNRRYIDLLLLRRRGNRNSLFFHLINNGVRNFSVKHIYDSVQRLFLP